MDPEYLSKNGAYNEDVQLQPYIFILIYRGFIPHVSKRTPSDQCPFRNGQNILETDIRFRNGHPFRNGQRNGGQMTMAIEEIFML